MNDASRTRQMVCLSPLINDQKVQLVEGNFMDRKDYERAWKVASSGLRGGDLDLVLFLSSECRDFSSVSFL